MDAKKHDERYIELAWSVLQVGNASEEEEACWAIIEREYAERKHEREATQAVVYGVIDLATEVA